MSWYSKKGENLCSSPEFVASVYYFAIYVYSSALVSAWLVADVNIKETPPVV